MLLYLFFIIISINFLSLVKNRVLHIDLEFNNFTIKENIKKYKVINFSIEMLKILDLNECLKILMILRYKT